VRHRIVLGSIIVLTAISAGAPRAEAGLRFCNQTTLRFKAAVGYADEKKAWVARGWFTVEPGQCKDALKFPLDNRFYYYYADGRGESERIKYVGSHPFCIETRAFRIPQADYGKATDEECAKDGLRSYGFKKIDVQGKPEFTINLGGADNPPDAPEAPSQANVPPPAAATDPRTVQLPPAAAAQQPPAAPPSATADPSMQPPRGRQQPSYPERQQSGGQQQPSATADPSMDPPRRRSRYREEEPGYTQQPGATDPSMDPPRRRRQQQYSQDPPAPSNVQQQPAAPAAQSGAPNGAACQRFPNLC
jgi:uncharacterized membrane protein